MTEPKEAGTGTLIRGGVAFGRKGYVGRLFIDGRPYIVCVERGTSARPADPVSQTVNLHCWRDPELWAPEADETMK